MANEFPEVNGRGAAQEQGLFFLDSTSVIDLAWLPEAIRSQISGVFAGLAR